MNPSKALHQPASKTPMPRHLGEKSPPEAKMPTAIVEIHGERFAVIPEAKYIQLMDLAEDTRPLPASLYEDEDVVDADEFVPQTIGKNLRSARQAAGLTQAELAKKLKKSQALVSGAERGVTEVGIRYWEAVLKACKLPKGWKPAP